MNTETETERQTDRQREGKDKKTNYHEPTFTGNMSGCTGEGIRKVAQHRERELDPVCIGWAQDHP